MVKKIMVMGVFLIVLLCLTSCKRSTKSELYMLMLPIKDDIFLFDDTSSTGLMKASNGEIIVDNLYDDLKCIPSNNLCITYRNEKYGIIDFYGNVKLEETYDYIRPINDNIVVAINEKHHQVMDYNGVVTVGPLDEGIRIIDYVSPDYIIVIKGEQYGIIDSDKNMVVNYLSANIEITNVDENNGIVYLKNENEKYGFINIEENLFVNPIYKERLDFSEHLSVAKIFNKYGYINDKNETIINFKYERANKFSEGLASVQYDSKFGFINLTGKAVIGFQYDEANIFFNGVAYVAYGSWHSINNFIPSEVMFINKQNNYIELVHNSSHEIDYKNSNYPLANYYISDNGVIYYKNRNEDYGLIVNSNSIVNQYGKTILNKTIHGVYYISPTMFCINPGMTGECYNMEGQKIIEHDYDLHYNYRTPYHIFKDKDETIYVYDQQGFMIYKTEKGEHDLRVSISGNYIVLLKGRNVLSYDVETKEEFIIYTIKK